MAEVVATWGGGGTSPATAFWTQVAGLARTATEVDTGTYWQQFADIARQFGMTSAQLASHLAAYVTTNATARAALTGLRNVLAAGLLGGSEAATVSSAIAAAEAAAARAPGPQGAG